MTLMGYSLEPWNGFCCRQFVWLIKGPDVSSPNPKQFVGFRSDFRAAACTYEYLPFGGGDRRCIGSAFALF
jgi:hypothetical protein